MNPLYLKWILLYSSVYGIDPKLATSIAQYESSGYYNTIGLHGEIGLFQIRPEYSKLTVNQLLNPKLNIQEGIKKLYEAKKDCLHQREYSWIVCYNVGVAGGRKIVRPKQFIYYRRVMSIYRRKK